ncbi:MAG: response regulator, partial [Desulfobacula sp.]|nr:response regulator [Desulfobacula sp.]
DIGVESELGKGTTLWIRLSLQLADEIEIPENNNSIAVENYKLTGKVLLVEDDNINQLVALVLLKTMGLEVELAKDGQQAVMACQEGRYDLILMDCRMPVMDGYEATGLIRKMEGTKKRTPVIAMTAHAIQGYREKCLKAGMDDYLTKPLKKEILLSTISKWIQNEPEQILAQNLYMKKPRTQNPIRGNEAIDIETAMAEFENDEDFFYEVFEEFLVNVEKQLIIIKQALDANDIETIMQESHSIKGGAANLVAMPLSDAASGLETLGKKGNLDDGKAVFDKLYYEFARLKEFKNK